MKFGICAGCGISIDKGQGGLPRRWCSGACRVRSIRREERTSNPPSAKSCRECDRDITDMYGNRKFCSESCRYEATKRRRRQPQEFECERCGVEFTRPTTRGRRPSFCLRCRTEQKFHRIPKSVREFVYERDVGICQLCFGPVDMDAAPRSDWSPSLDHIKCLSWGEIDHSPENLRLTHFWCNSTRADDSDQGADLFKGVA